MWKQCKIYVEKIKNTPLFLYVYRIDKYYFLFINWQQRFNIFKNICTSQSQMVFYYIKKKKNI